jgi:hypothetical protein
MRRSTSFGRWLVLAVAWLGSPPWPVRAQPQLTDVIESKRVEKAAEEDKGPPRISVLRLQVVKPDPPQANNPGGFIRRNRFGMMDAAREGTSVTFVLDEPQQSIIGVESNDSKITRFTDDKGTDLLAPPPEPAAGVRPMRAQFVGQEEGPIVAEVDPAGHRATITVHSPHLPAGGATRVSVEAVLVVRYAKGEKTIEQKGVNLKLDKFTAGPYPLIVASQDDANRMMGQAGGMQVILFHQGPMRDIKKVAFIGPDGEEIQSRQSGSGSTGTLQQTYYWLSKKVETCTIRVTAPEAVETVSMEVGINTGVGFPAGARRRILPAPGARPADAVAAPR